MRFGRVGRGSVPLGAGSGLRRRVRIVFPPSDPGPQAPQPECDVGQHPDGADRIRATSKKAMYGRDPGCRDDHTMGQSYGHTHVRKAAGSAAGASNQTVGLHSSVPETTGPGK